MKENLGKTVDDDSMKRETEWSKKKNERRVTGRERKRQVEIITRT
jgi:hypothetical protein